MSRSLFFLLICAYAGDIVRSQKSSDFHCKEPEWFKCANEKCLSIWFVCDGEDDCGDNTDEKNCSERLKTCDFRCKNGNCVDDHRICDGFDDCTDASDEINCGNETLLSENCNNEINRFLCDNGRCIFLNNACNKIDDCGDESDENEAECEKSEELCKSAGCSHNCVKTPKGPLCSCPLGYKLENNQTCTDINECSEDEKLCDQRCINAAGSYSCVCESGYDLQEDGKSCKARGGEATMIYSSTRAIARVYLENMMNFPIVENLQRVKSVSMMDNYIYWSDIENRTIMRSNDYGTDRRVIATAGLALPEVIAIDWITGNVYFIDDHWKHIGVCSENGEFCTIILCDMIAKPGGLILHPKKGQMFWSDYGENAKIYRSSMDGKMMSILVEKNVGSPKGLAIDYPNDRLYWYDEKYERIESILADGTERRELLRTTGSRVYAMAIFEDKLYFSDWRAGTIESVDKSRVGERKTIVKESKSIYGIHIEHPVLKEKMINPCENQSCAQLCLLAWNFTFSCACKSGEKLNDDARTCAPAKIPIHLVIASGEKFIDYRHEIIGKPRITDEPSSKRVSQIAYDSLTGSLIANDDISNGIYRFTSGIDEIPQIATANGEFLGDIDFDHNGNNVYSTNVNDRRIEIRSIATGGTTSFSCDDEPRDILVISKYGLMYVVFKWKNSYSIEKLSMNGNNRKTIVHELRGPKISLAHDDELERIFFSDESTGRIETMTVFGQDRKILRTNVEGIVNLAVMDRKIFWTLRNSNVLQWIDERDDFLVKKTVVLPVEEIVEIMDIVGVGDIYHGDKHACRNDNGGCSHVCLVAEAGNNEISTVNTCACPPAMILNSDNRTCAHRNPQISGGSEKCKNCALSC